MTLRRPNTPPNPIASLSTVLRSAASRTVNVMCIGDSVTEGAEATSFVDNRWVKLLGTNLQANYNHSIGGIGWVNCVSAIQFSPGGTSSVTWTGAGAHSSVLNDTRAFGARYMAWATDEVVTLGYTGTSFKLQYALGGSSFTVNVDGGGAVTVTPSAGSTLQGAYSSPVLAHATHSAVITPTSGQALAIKGAVIYDGDEANGIIMYENAQYGNTSGDALTTYASVTGLTDQLSANFCVNPALVVIMLGLNDDNKSVPTATYTSNLQGIIANIKSLSASSPAFLVCGQWSAPGYATNAAAFDSAAQAVATADPTNVIYSSFLNTITSGASTLYADNIHPNNAGEVAIANQISALFSTTTASFSDGGTRPHPFSPGLAR